MSPGCHRRGAGILGGLLGVVLLVATPVTPTASAKSAASKIQSHRYDDGLGLTVELRLDHAPYAARKSAEGRNTVMVFFPWFWLWEQPPARGRRGLDTLVFFHGHSSRADWAMLCPEHCSRRGKDRYLREQVVASRQNIMVVVPQGPWVRDSSDGGRLDNSEGFTDMMTEVRKVVTSRAMNAIRKSVASRVARSARKAGHGGLASKLTGSWSRPMDRSMRIGRIALAAFSGGYKVLANCIARGGLEVHEVYLFDALYGELRTFRDWLLATQDITGRDPQWWLRHRLVTYEIDRKNRKVAQGTASLRKMLDRADFPYAREEARSLLTLEEFEQASAVFSSRKELRAEHRSAVHKGWQLRDCLLTSAFTRLRRFKEVDDFWAGEDAKPRAIDKNKKSP